jgi:hypothetical protein
VSGFQTSPAHFLFVIHRPIDLMRKTKSVSYLRLRSNQLPVQNFLVADLVVVPCSQINHDMFISVKELHNAVRAAFSPPYLTTKIGWDEEEEEISLILLTITVQGSYNSYI